MGTAGKRDDSREIAVRGDSVAGDLACIGCAYNLRTLDVTGRCPECGLEVAESLGVLPHAQTAARAIRLAAWATIFHILLLWFGLLSPLAWCIFLMAVHRLRYVHRLRHEPTLYNAGKLGRLIRWLWWTAAAGTIGSVLSVGGLLLVGPPRAGTFAGLLAERFLPSTPSSTVASVANGVMMMAIDAKDSGIAGGVAVLQGMIPGGRHVEIRDEEGKAVSTVIVKRGGPAATAVDRNGGRLSVTMDAWDNITVEARDGASIVISSAGTFSKHGPSLLSNWPGRLLGAGIMLLLLGQLSVVLYLLTARALAVRVRRADLGKAFSRILWLLVLVLPGIAVAASGTGRLIFLSLIHASPSQFMTLASMVPTIPLLSGLLIVSAVALIVATVLQIGRSLQLSRILLMVPTTMSEFLQRGSRP